MKETEEDRCFRLLQRTLLTDLNFHNAMRQRTVEAVEEYLEEQHWTVEEFIDLMASEKISVPLQFTHAYLRLLRK